MFKPTAIALFLATTAHAGVMQYGDADLCNTGTYGSDPLANALNVGLAAGVVSLGDTAFGHAYPFGPQLGDYAGTDQIYVGSTQTNAHDGYAGSGSRISGPQVITMDYSSLVNPGDTIATLTLGIMTDDFQFPSFSQPYVITINGQAYQPLVDAVQSIDESGPVARFLAIGIDTSLLTNDHLLTLSIDQAGDGGDGWAVDFLTIGVTTTPAPASASLLGFAALAVARRRR